MLRWFCFLFLFSVATDALAQPFDWSSFDKVLKQSVREERNFNVRTNVVDYVFLQNHVEFEAIGDRLASYDDSLLSTEEKIAFYINSYNYFAIKIVVDHWPVESIKDIGSFFSPVWDKPAGIINGKDVSLNYIEHKVLRKLDEPRIHFAIVCSSYSCPSLRREVFAVDRLDDQLDDQTRMFLQNEDKGLAIKGNRLHLSKIFDWFEEDFESQGGILSFISHYDARVATYESFEMLDYNWSLNIYSENKFN